MTRTGPRLSLRPMRSADLGQVRARGTGVSTIRRTLVNRIRATHPAAGVIADPEAANLPSRPVLENNHFVLLAEPRPPSEPTKALMAIHRLPRDPNSQPNRARPRADNVTRQ